MGATRSEWMLIWSETNVRGFSGWHWLCRCGTEGGHQRVASSAIAKGRFAARASFAALCLAFSLALPLSAVAAPPAPLLLAAGAIGQGQTGTIKGRLVWGDDKIPEAKELVAKGKAAKDPDICAVKGSITSRDIVVDPKTQGVSYGIAYLRRPTGDFTEQVKKLLDKNPTVVLDQKGCEFQPYILAFHKDQKLILKSSDPVGHNVRFSGFTNSGINTMIAPSGQFQTALEAEKLPMELHCDIHSWMKGWLLVLDHPFVAITGADGSFEIKDVPAGNQNLLVWHSEVGFTNPGAGRGVAVSVKAGEATDAGEFKVDPAKVDPAKLK
jgi:hypothetical protein